VLINHIAVNFQTTNTERDRVWAYAKAQAILAEIQGYVDRGQVDAAVDLDVLDDGIVSRGVMSIQEDANGALVAADHPVSGNYQRDGDWHWWRRITVQPFLGLNNRNVRYVTVRIYKKDRHGVEHPMADLSAVINSAGSAFPTTQVFDVYLLAIENIPGWWVFMDSIKPFVESMITDLENRNPGLIFRTHWITKASFGRNQTYRPYTNDDTDSHAVIPDVYHYPGRMPAGNASTSTATTRTSIRTRTRWRTTSITRCAIRRSWPCGSGASRPSRRVNWRSPRPRRTARRSRRS
jgi:hypothetical protein